MWSGLPSWAGMIEELALFIEASGANADLVRAEAQKGDLHQAASYGFDTLTKQQIGEFIRNACRYGLATPHDIHRKIISLGPRCFVTTNYDNLIEESLSKWQPDRFFPPPVTNRHLTETANIVHARAIDFIFKPHGDVADSESIILTREQYRQLLPQGERQAALESLKTLLASRPVVYLGFGLRDLDFIYIRDILANTYKGGIRDHYAIMADVTSAECDFWRRNYGIHLVSYTTTKLIDSSRNHTPLLTFLDTLLEKEPASVPAAELDPYRPEVVLALARHAASLARSQKLTSEFRIRVHSKTKNLGGNFIPYNIDRFDHSTVETFLDYGPDRAVLVGSPGAGKTYAFRRSAARLANNLHEHCLSESFDVKSATVPILADLKLYRGDFEKLLNEALPRGLCLIQLVRFFNVKIFLDSFNEMPKEYWENGSYESDLAKLIVEAGGSSLVIGSRTSDGLDKLEFPLYSLDQISKADVVAEMKHLDIEISGRFSREMWSLLQRPFYFQQVTSGAIRLPAEARPRDFYRLWLNNLRSAMETRFSVQIDIANVLALTAYDALNRGEEAFPLSVLLRILRTNIESLRLCNIDAREIANWLVSYSVLIPHTGGRVAFIHQSVTEYLAASELACRYQSSPHVLKETLSTTRWDQALFLTLSLLPVDLAKIFVDDIIKTDFALALRAVKYLEVGSERLVSELLSKIPDRMHASGPVDRSIELAVEFSLPITHVHERPLRTLIALGDMIGAAGVSRLVELKGESVKDELLRLLVDNCGDYNLCCNGIAPALKPFATAQDAKMIAEWAGSIQVTSDYDQIRGFISGSATFLSGLEVTVIRQEFLPTEAPEEVSAVRAEILCSILQRLHSTAALDCAGELLCRGIREAATSIYFISNFAPPDIELSWESFTPVHVQHLMSILCAEDSWALPALRCLCTARPDLSETVKQAALSSSGIHRAALSHCIDPTDFVPVFQALGELVGMTDEQRREQPLQLFDHFECDWTGQEGLLVRLLRLRDVWVAESLLCHSFPPSILGLTNLGIGAIDWWLDWMMEVQSRSSGWRVLAGLGGLFGQHLNVEVQNEFVCEFNKPDSKFRRLLLRFVLPSFTDITTDIFSDEAISFLLADLSRKGSTSSFYGHLLGSTATEDFVIERLVPLLPDAKQPLLGNLHSVLRQAGSRHSRRYFSEVPT